MAFALANFSPVGGQSARGKAPQRFSYLTDDTIATVNTAAYFNSISGLLNIGDIIDVVVVDDPAAITSVSAVAMVVVVSNAAGVVDVADGTVITVTDSD